MEMHAKQIDEKDGRLWFERGVRCLERHEYGNALDNVERAAELTPDNARACFNKGVCLREMGHAEHALSCFEKVPWILKNRAADTVQCQTIAMGLRCSRQLRYPVHPPSLGVHS